MACIYLSVLQSPQGIDVNAVIKCESISKYPPIVYYTFESLRPYCHGLDILVFVIKEEQNRQILRCVRRGFMPFVFFVNKQVLYF